MEDKELSPLTIKIGPKNDKIIKTKEKLDLLNFAFEKTT